MWRMMPRLAIATLLAATILAGEADASAVQSYLYNTSGDIDGNSGSGYGFPISFSPQSGPAMLTTPGTFTLGSFTTSPLPTGATLMYDNTPFTINVYVGQVPNNNGNYYGGYNPYYPGYNYFSSSYAYKISGVLNGNLQGDGTSTLFPTITSVTGSGNGSDATPPFPVSDLKFNLPQGIAAPNGTTYGMTTLSAFVDVTGNPLPAPAPEPTSVAAFALALAGWAWKRRRSRSRNAPVRHGSRKLSA